MFGVQVIADCIHEPIVEDDTPNKEGGGTDETNRRCTQGRYTSFPRAQVETVEITSTTCVDVSRVEPATSPPSLAAALTSTTC